ncbi:MAG: hypothetical protein K2F73_03930, partial [Ruminococcus sp.]|nr:hypothetical protein [Ruminococcus sp.]
MSKKIWFLALTCLALVFSLAFLDDTKRYIKGNEIDFNSSKQVDFSDPYAMISGEIDFVYGP